MKRLVLPLALAALALIEGLGTGPVWYWCQAKKLIAEAKEQQREKQDEAHQAQRAQGWDFWTIEIENLATDLKDERVRLRQRSDELDQREARLNAEQQDLEKLRGQIEAVRQDIDDRVVAVGADEAKNLKVLAQTYTDLTPEAAVAIIHDLDDTTAVKILSLMKPDAVGPIFEAMTRASGPDGSQAHRAAVLSEKIRMMKAGVTPSAPPPTP